MEVAHSAIAAGFAAGSETVALTRGDLRPARPFEGRLFQLLATAAGGAPVGAAVGTAGGASERVAGTADRRSQSSAAVGAAPVRLLVPAVWLADRPAPDIFGVADHVNLRLRAALTGRWPASAPRSFPDLSAVYKREPPPRRLPSGARVYSGLTVAGVGDVRALTAFESRAIDQLSLPAASDSLVDAVIVAAHYGLSVTAWCVPLPA